MTRARRPLSTYAASQADLSRPTLRSDALVSRSPISLPDTMYCLSRPFALATLSLALAPGAVAQNDDCATAMSVGLGATAYNTASASPSLEPFPCAWPNAPVPDLWFVHTATATGPLTFDTCGSSHDTLLHVLQGACGAQASVACNDDHCGAHSSVTVPGAAVGDVFYLRVGGFLGQTGAGVLNVTQVPPSGLVNDECAGALLIGLGSTSFDTTGALTSLPTWSCANGGADIWFTYVATSAQTVRFETCASSFDTALEVYRGTCGALTSLACDDDGCGLQSVVHARPSGPGDALYLRVGGYASSSGAGTLVVSEVPSPVHDDCAGALPLLAGVPTSFDTTGAAPSATPFDCELAPSGGDLWFAYTPTSASVALAVETCGSSVDTIVAAYEGTCGSLAPLDCSREYCFEQGRVNVTSVLPGRTYYFRVAGEAGSFGAGSILLEEIAPPVFNCVVNPSFETGDLAGWSLSTVPFVQPAMVAPAGISFGLNGGLFTSSPTDGTYSFSHPFAGVFAGVTTLSQPLEVTSGVTPLTFDWRAGWDFLNWGNVTMDRHFDVVVRDVTTGAPLQSTRIMSMLPNTETADTGVRQEAVDLSMFLGQTVQVSFEWSFPASTFEIAFFELDNISCPFGGGSFGTNYCMANPNSTGSVGSISVSGSPVVAASSLTLTASALPPGAFGIFLTSQTQAFNANPGGSQGNLCLGGSIGRYVGPGQIQASGASGQISMAVDLTQTPTPAGAVSIQTGQTWNFQAWHRDVVGGAATSNFTDAIEVDFL